METKTPNVAELVRIAVEAALQAAGVSQNSQAAPRQSASQTTEHKPRGRAKRAPGKVIELPPQKKINWDGEEKVCPKCNRSKLLREFGARPRRGRMYVQSYCTKCRGTDYSHKPRKYHVK